MLILPVLGGLAILGLPVAQAKKARSLAMLVCLATFLLSMLAAVRFDWSKGSYAPYDAGHSHVQLALGFDWIRALGARYSVGVDGLSLPMLIMATLVTLLACAASYGVSKAPRGYFALLLFFLSGAIGVFVSLDLLLFYIFFELSMVPMFFLIGIWGNGGARGQTAAMKMFLFSLVGSVAMLCVVLGVYYHTRGIVSDRGGVLDMIDLATMPEVRLRFGYGGGAFGFGAIAFWLMFLACGTRIPCVPLHTWVADSHAEASTPVSMLLSAVAANMGAYGLVRACYALFPEQAAAAWYYTALIGVASIVYGALVAMSQRDLKRVVAGWSVSNLGYVVLGLAVMTPMALTGALYQMLAHALTATMLFFALGVIFDRANHREIVRLGGLWAQMPAYTGWTALAFLAAMGLPGLCGFVGQLLVLLGAFSAGDVGGIVMKQTGGAAFSPLMWFGAIAAGASLLTIGYLVWTLQRVFMGAAKPEHHHFAGLTRSEKWILAALGTGVIAMGVAPMLVLDRLRPAVEGLMELMKR